MKYTFKLENWKQIQEKGYQVPQKVVIYTWLAKEGEAWKRADAVLHEFNCDIQGEWILEEFEEDIKEMEEIRKIQMEA